MDVERFAASPIGSLTEISGIDGRFNTPFRHYAYVANPLGAEPTLKGETWHAVADAAGALARLDQASRQVPNPRVFLRPTLRREAQSTSALEGTFAPLEQVLAAEAGDAQSRSKELREVLNYVEAATSAFDLLEQGRAITVSLLEGVQQILVRGTGADTEEAGHIRTIQVAIGSPTGSVEDARFVPMPPGVSLTAGMHDLTRWVGDGRAVRNGIVAAALSHYQFETLHPFNDGNGRIGRLMIVLQLMADRLISAPLLSVSPWFETRRPEYQDGLATVSATGDWDEWVRFFAAGITSSAEDTARRVDRMLSVHARYVQRLHQAGARGVIRDIVDALLSDQVITVSMMTARFARTAPAVSAAIQRLMDLNILSGPYGTYGRQYIAVDMLRAVTVSVGKVPDRDDPMSFDIAPPR